MIDRKLGDKPITFEVSVGKCRLVSSSPKQRGTVKSKGMLSVIGNCVSVFRSQLQNRTYI